MQELFKDKVALVTGAGSGIGRAAALLFAEEGAKVVVSGRTIENGDETVRLIKEVGGEAVFVKADVSKQEDVERLVAETVGKYQALDCALNNAGISESHDSGTITCSEEEWRTIIDINLKGVWLSMRSEIPQMLKQGKGAIVNVSSFAGLTASKLGLVAYSGSKHGVIGLTKTSAVEFAGQGIRINAVCPGATMTAMLKKRITKPEEKERVASMNPMHRIASPREVAEAAVWLCSDRASFVTGIAMPVDGGQVIF
jgi:NAD(P)-dependent dehydrogenase (short-subunit alcohol dehydrogenase family)